MKIPVPNYY